jgi:Holliday junction DNA helicase RuvB
MQFTTEDIEILERVLEWEKNANEYDIQIGWSWKDARCYVATVNKMIVEGKVRESYHSHSLVAYLVTEECKLAFQAMREPVVDVNEAPIDLAHIFDDIVGYDDVKELMQISLDLDKPVHILLHGPPAIAKSMFLWDIERAYGALALAIIGSGASKAGMWDLIEERRPRILLVDELEKMNMKDTTALLSLMQYGRLIRAKVGRRMDIQIDCWVFATANRIDNFTPELLSRFAKFPLKPYTDQEFIQVVKTVLVKTEGSTEEEASMIAELLIDKTNDIRDAIRVARTSKKVGVARAIELLIR